MLKRNERILFCIEDAPLIAGLCFRRMTGGGDVSLLGQVTRQADDVDGLEDLAAIGNDARAWA